MTGAPSVADLVAEARPAERSVELCLRGDLVAAIEDVRRRQAVAEQQPRDSLADDPTGGLAAELADLKAHMAEATIVVTLRAIPRRRWLALVAAHTPRAGVDSDAKIGVNTTTFYDDLIVESWAAPDVPDDDLAALLDVLSAGQFNDLAEAAWSVNTRAVNVPFGWRASPPTPG